MGKIGEGGEEAVQSWRSTRIVGLYYDLQVGAEGERFLYGRLTVWNRMAEHAVEHEAPSDGWVYRRSSSRQGR